jgi:hypothetical protein
MFCTSSYVPDSKAHINKSDITGEVAASGGYVAGGFALSHKTVSYDSVNDKTILDADDLELMNVTINGVRTIVIYDDTGNPATSSLIGYIDLGVDRGVTNGYFGLVWSTNGIFVHTVS